MSQNQNTDLDFLFENEKRIMQEYDVAQEFFARGLKDGYINNPKYGGPFRLKYFQREYERGYQDGKQTRVEENNLDYLEKHMWRM